MEISNIPENLPLGPLVISFVDKVVFLATLQEEHNSIPLHLRWESNFSLELGLRWVDALESAEAVTALLAAEVTEVALVTFGALLWIAGDDLRSWVEADRHVLGIRSAKLD
jgi:hypothetical protein